MVYQYYLTLLLKGLKMKLSLFFILLAIYCIVKYYTGLDIAYHISAWGYIILAYLEYLEDKIDKIGK